MKSGKIVEKFFKKRYGCQASRMPGFRVCGHFLWDLELEDPLLGWRLYS
jgi:hypothetical protein